MTYPTGFLGPHLLYDAQGCNETALTSMESLYAFLDGLPGRIGMTKITQPYVFPYSGVNPDDWGITGVVVLAESHCSVHTFPQYGFVTLDIYSCKEFPVEQVLQELEAHFTPQRSQAQLVRRGEGLFMRT